MVSAEVLEDQVVSGRCYCECVPGMLKFANTSDILAALAPRPLLIVSGIHDTVFPVLRARRAYLRVKEIYELLSVRDRITYIEIHAGHEFSLEMRSAVYRWFSKWLLYSESDIEEKDLDLESDTSPSLSCLHEPKGETIDSIYCRKATELAKGRRVSPEEWLQSVDELRKVLVEEVSAVFPKNLSSLKGWGSSKRKMWKSSYWRLELSWI